MVSSDSVAEDEKRPPSRFFERITMGGDESGPEENIDNVTGCRMERIVRETRLQSKSRAKGDIYTGVGRGWDTPDLVQI
jgi:hypothetical protein